MTYRGLSGSAGLRGVGRGLVDLLLLGELGSALTCPEIPSSPRIFDHHFHLFLQARCRLGETWQNVIIRQIQEGLRYMPSKKGIIPSKESERQGLNPAF